MPASAVLERLAKLRDHEPLTSLVVRLGKSGALAEAATAGALRSLLGIGRDVAGIRLRPRRVRSGAAARR